MHQLIRWLFLLALLWCAPALAEDFDGWREALKREAAAQGISATAIAALDAIEPDPRVTELDQKQPEHKITFAEYRRNQLSDYRLKHGRAFMAQHAAILDDVAATYGVPKKYLVALWGMETSYGAVQGKFNIIQSLATLAYEGRRAAFFRAELLTALRMIDHDHLTPDTLRGSWAGAMGQCQFMPSTFMRYAVDGDNDGSRDIWNSLPDVFTSMANYLRAEGWQRGLKWGMPVRARRPIAPQLVGLTQAQPLTVWQKLGIRAHDGHDLRHDAVTPYYLVQPDGAAGQSYLVTANYKVIMRWNRSTYFATMVGLLADRIGS